MPHVTKKQGTERDLFEWHAANVMQPQIAPTKSVDVVVSTIKGLRDGNSYNRKYPMLIGMWEGWLLSKARHIQLIIAAVNLAEAAQGSESVSLDEIKEAVKEFL